MMWLSVKVRNLLSPFIVIVVLSSPAFAQYDVELILRQVISQLQTGSPNPTWYGIQLWNTIAFQTGNTGIYPQLVLFGPVNNITITQQQPLPTGMLYSATVKHQNGTSTWILGISSLTNRIEYANVNFGGIPQQIPSGASNVPAGPNPPSNPPPEDKTSPACQKFPNLC
jgi:hypothetical protein